jgi:hypothetical protein
LPWTKVRDAFCCSFVELAKENVHSIVASLGSISMTPINWHVKSIAVGGQEIKSEDPFCNGTIGTEQNS